MLSIIIFGNNWHLSVFSEISQEQSYFFWTWDGLRLQLHHYSDGPHHDEWHLRDNQQLRTSLREIIWRKFSLVPSLKY